MARARSRMVPAASSLDMRGSSSRTVRGDEGEHVGIHPEAGPCHLQVVGADHVHLFFLQLGPAVLYHVPGLHGEAADELARAAVLPQIGEDVMGAGQRDGQIPVLLFILSPLYWAGV